MHAIPVFQGNELSPMVALDVRPEKPVNAVHVALGIAVFSYLYH